MAWPANVVWRWRILLALTTNGSPMTAQPWYHVCINVFWPPSRRRVCDNLLIMTAVAAAVGCAVSVTCDATCWQRCCLCALPSMSPTPCSVAVTAVMASSLATLKLKPAHYGISTHARTRARQRARTTAAAAHSRLQHARCWHAARACAPAAAAPNDALA